MSVAIYGGFKIYKSNNGQLTFGELNLKKTTAATVKAKPQDLLKILDSYDSLLGLRQELLNIKAKNKVTGKIITGHDLLAKFLVEKKYSPILKNEEKINIIESLFEQYTLPQSGTKMFIVNVANGLWTEKNAGLPWSLKDMESAQIAKIFIQNDSVNDYSVNAYEGRPELPNMVNVYHQISVPEPNTVVEESSYQQYNIARKIAAGAKTQRQAVEKIVSWGQKNFFHANDEYPWDVYLDGKTVQPPISYWNSYPLSLRRIYDERVIGCQEPTIFLQGMLHNLNIPAIRLSVWNHGVLYLPSLDLYVHGDAVAMYKYPTKMIILTPEEFQPIAEVEANFVMPIYEKYSEKFKTYLTIERDDKELNISTGSFYVYPAKTCINIAPGEWERMVQNYKEFEPYYDKTTCQIKGKNPQPLNPLEVLDK